MPRTFNRQPYSVSTKTNDHTKQYFLTQTSFKGLCDQKNDVTIDQQTFVDAKNVYIDEAGSLVSRPPLVIEDIDNQCNIFKQWIFGEYHLRLYKSSNSYIISCISHDMIPSVQDDKYPSWSWTFADDTIDDDYEPKVNCAQIEDKIFIWFAGIDLIALNTSGALNDNGDRQLYFEDAQKYLYIPISSLVLNGIETDLESKNFLTDAYKRRYQQSVVSSINFEKLLDRDMSVGVVGDMTQSTSKHLYDITVQEHQEKALIYPYSPLGNNYHVDIVETPRATVVMRYSFVFNTIEVSYDGVSYSPVPKLNNIIGEPQLTKDGMWIVAFTPSGLAKCKLVAQETTDTEDTVMVWTEEAYLEGLSDNDLQGCDASFIPSGYFDTIDNFVYIVKVQHTVVADDESLVTANMPVLYTRWFDGVNGTARKIYPLFIAANTGNYASMITSDDIKLSFNYIAANANNSAPWRNNSGVAISLLADKYQFYDTTDDRFYLSNIPCIMTILFSSNSDFPIEPSGIPTTDYFDDLLVLPADIEYNDKTYSFQRYGIPCKNCDLHTSCSVLDGTHLHYRVAFNSYNKSTDNEYLYFDIHNTFDYLYTEPSDEDQTEYEFIVIEGKSVQFKSDADITITDRYMIVNGNVMSLPDNGLLSPFVDKDRVLTNNDCLMISLRDGDYEYSNVGNIHKLTVDGENLASGHIMSGDLISFTKDAITESDYLRVGDLNTAGTAYIDEPSNRFYVECIGIDDDGSPIAVNGDLSPGQLIRLRAYSTNIELPVGNPGNETSTIRTILPWTYPAEPEGWNVGDEWPETWTEYSKPLWPGEDGSLRIWRAGDALPEGEVMLYGVIDIVKRIQPVYVTSDGVWYIIDGELWTSKVSSRAYLELDETIVINGMTNSVPDHHVTMNEHYFSFVSEATGSHLLEITSTRRDEDKLFSEDGTDFLLYLPKRNEQKFSSEITNLHRLSDTEVGIFTNDEIWYVTSVTSDDGTVSYSSPIKSRIPVGCRKGDEVITALDGQAIIFPTPTGITALAPQDFIATTEKTLNYLSDAIQHRYSKFYTDVVSNVISPVIDNVINYSPKIKISLYKYWIMFYKYMDHEILLFDTRGNTWWSWTTPYPIRDISVGDNLFLLMQIDYFQNRVNSTNLGVSFVFDFSHTIYKDNVIEGALSGLHEITKDNEYVDTRIILKYPSSVIDWSFTSQKLHFDQINNYKAIKAMNINLAGDGTMAILTIKAYRDMYHPEKSDVIKIDVNTLRSFVERFNIIHVVNFQYTIRNDIAEVDNQHQLRINSISTKYEVKERIR